MSFLFSQQSTVMRPRLQFSLCPLCSRWQVFSPRKSSTVVKPYLHLIQFSPSFLHFLGVPVAVFSFGRFGEFTLSAVEALSVRTHKHFAIPQDSSNHTSPKNLICEPQDRHRTPEILFQRNGNAAGKQRRKLQNILNARSPE